jgi:hypothetical protein
MKSFSVRITVDFGILKVVVATGHRLDLTGSRTPGEAGDAAPGGYRNPVHA